MKEKNKYTSYILVTVAYILAVLFVLGGEPTNSGSRFLIVILWLSSMLIAFMYELENKNKGI